MTRYWTRTLNSERKSLNTMLRALFFQILWYAVIMTMTSSKFCKYWNAVNRNVSTLLTSFFYKIITNDQFANLYWELGCYFLLKKLTRANSLLWPIVLFLVKIFFVKRFSVNHVICKSVLIYPFGLLLKKIVSKPKFCHS